VDGVLCRYVNVFKELSCEVKGGLLIVINEISKTNDDTAEPPNEQKFILVFNHPKPWPYCRHIFLNLPKKVVFTLDIFKEGLLPL
jgi:hypothetical protein